MMILNSYICVILSVIPVSARVDIDEGIKGAPAVCTVKLDLDNYHESRDECPDEVKAEVIVDNAKHTLSLTLSEAIHQRHEGRKTKDDTIPLIIGSDSSLTSLWTSQKLLDSDKTCFYQDLGTAAAVSIKFTDTGHEILGSYIHGNHSRIIIPASKSKARLRRRAVKEGRDHVVYTQEQELGEKRKEELRKLTRQKRQTLGYYYVEYVVVIDYSLYSRFRRRDPHGNDQSVISDIYYHFSHVVNEMDLAYRQIQATDFQISIKLKHIYIAKTSDKSSWTEFSGKIIDVNTILDNFVDWNPQSKLPSYDHAALFTAKDLHQNGATDTRGLAQLKQICQDTSLSINEDDGLFLTATIAAHELGHSLGAVHDGNGNSCRGDSQYIMTAVLDTRSEQNVINSKTFSTCSVQAFRDTLMSLDPNNCLTNYANNWDENVFSNNLKILPGQKYNIQEQCRLQMGNASKYCGTQQYTVHVCEELMCLDPSDGVCYRVVVDALEGTTCGDGMWCKDRKCIYSADAPRLDDPSCVYGDIPQGILVKETRLSCEQYVYEHPGWCYEMVDLCCSSCKSHYNPNNRGCEYGDVDTFCSKMHSSNCYSLAKDCCETCKIFETDDLDCRYGDKVSGCQPYVENNPGVCYTADFYRQCCGTCKKHMKSSSQECRYGDRAKGCGDALVRDPGLCYSQRNREQCCETCNNNFRENSPECQYGDRVKGCGDPGLCYSQEHREQCCETCSNNFRENSPGCEYGDSSRQCAGIEKRRCYQNYETCCETCSKLESDDPDCRFGDRALGCYAANCNLFEHRQSCCETCGNRHRSNSYSMHGMTSLNIFMEMMACVVLSLCI